MSAKDTKEFVAQALLLGWRFVGLTKSGHMKFHHDNGKTYIAGGTPSDHRARKNALADMKRLAK